MPMYYPLDKILAVGDEYTMAADRFFIITQIGTNDTATAMLVVDGQETGEYSQNIAPLVKTTTYGNDLLDLGQYYYVIPPNKTYRVVGSSAKLMRIKGYIGKLAPGEQMPAEHAIRFSKQHQEYLTQVLMSKLYSTDYSWSDGEEIEIGTITPTTIEQYVFDNIMMVTTGVSSLVAGNVGVILKVDGAPLDILTSGASVKGIDAYVAPRPPSGSAGMTPFNLKATPIVLDGDHTLTVSMINNSGSSLTVSAATDQYVEFVATYKRK